MNRNVDQRLRRLEERHSPGMIPVDVVDASGRVVLERLTRRYADGSFGASIEFPPVSPSIEAWAADVAELRAARVQSRSGPQLPNREPARSPLAVLTGGKAKGATNDKW